MSSAKIDVVALTVDELLAPNSSAFQVPPFQRGYSWDSDEIGQFLNDVFSRIEWDGAVSDTNYFIGSIVLSKSAEGPQIILDGQQRLTTISLLLAALKAQFKIHDPSSAGLLEKYLEVGRIGGKKSPKIQLQEGDDERLARLLADPQSAESPDATKDFRKSRLANAMRIIRTEIISVLELCKRPPKEAIEKIVAQVLYSVEFVRIVAPNEAEAFKLFETLNDRGLPLSAADLIKNKIYSVAGKEYRKDVHEAWQDILDKVDRDQLVYFLRYFWIANEGPVRREQLYERFHQRLHPMRGSEVAAFCEKVRRFAGFYAQIHDPKPETCTWGPSVGESLQRLNNYRARGCRPALLVCAERFGRHFEKLVKACESITVRYSIIGQKNSGISEGNYFQLAEKLRTESDVADISQTVLECFRNVPDDQEFRETFAQVNIDNPTTVHRQLLTVLNELLSTGETKLVGSNKVHIEHIFPQTPSEEALLESGVSREDKDSLICRIGNLTLLSGRKNQEVSNSAYSQKKAVYASSEIRLTQEILRISKKRWGEKEIDKRSKELA